MNTWKIIKYRWYMYRVESLRRSFWNQIQYGRRQRFCSRGRMPGERPRPSGIGMAQYPWRRNALRTRSKALVARNRADVLACDMGRPRPRELYLPRRAAEWNR